MLLRRAYRPPRKKVIDPSRVKQVCRAVDVGDLLHLPQGYLAAEVDHQRTELHASLRAYLTAVKVVDGAEFVLEGDIATAEAVDAGRHLELLTTLDFVFEPQETEAPRTVRRNRSGTDKPGP
jgi:hypothetical protein